MTSVLVSGAQLVVSPLADALRSRGADVTEVVDLDEMPAVCAKAGPGAFDSYVQLPSTFQMAGETAVDRVHHFYAHGVLARFPALGAAVQALKPDASITFVLAQLPAEVASKDDRQARLSLTRVLSHAACADATGATFSVSVLHSDATFEDILAASLGEAADRRGLDQLSHLDYADWRVEVMGLAALET